jgi:hypothetical protein
MLSESRAGPRIAHYRREDVFAEANRKIVSTMRPQAPAAR